MKKYRTCYVLYYTNFLSAQKLDITLEIMK